MDNALALSITSKMAQSTYTSADQFLADVEASAASLLHMLAPAHAPPKGGAQWQYVPDSLEQDRLRAHIESFKKLAKTMIVRETPTRSEMTRNVNDFASWQDDKAVLTLYGNAQGHKQLFSSLQKPLQTQSVTTSNIRNEAVMPFREAGLPNGIQSTRVMPFINEPPGDAKTTATILTTFPPPATLPQLNPPKSTAKPVRDSTITWTQSGAESSATRKLGYTAEKLPTGQWLGYGGIGTLRGSTSPGAKRKQRDRALSTTEPTSKTSQALKAAQLQAREDALFSSVYSSFAPTRDNSTALIPDEAKSDVWWKRMGRDWYNQVVGYDGYEEDEVEARENIDEPVVLDVADLTDDEIARLGQASLQAEPSSNKTPDNSEVLDNISEMLETLYSYQRIRNCSNTAATRPGIGASSTASDTIGTPSTPSAGETALYNKLLAQLIEIIANMAPYDVAKLNGDQMAALNVGRTITYTSKSYTGTMEEDQSSRAAKAVAAAAAAAAVPAGPSQRAAASGTSTPQYASGYAQTRTAQMGQNRASHHSGGGGGGSSNGTSTATPSYSNRQASSFLRQPLSSWQSSTTAGNTSNVQRPPFAQHPRSQTSYTATSHRNAQNAVGARSAAQSYSQSQAQLQAQPPPLTQYLQRGTAQAGIAYGSTPSQPLYQQRAQAAHANALAAQSHSQSHYRSTPQHGRSGSPAKPLSYTGVTPRTGFGPPPPPPQAPPQMARRISDYVPTHALPGAGAASPLTTLTGVLPLKQQQQQQQPAALPVVGPSAGVQADANTTSAASAASTAPVMEAPVQASAQSLPLPRSEDVVTTG